MVKKRSKTDRPKPSISKKEIKRIAQELMDQYSDVFKKLANLSSKL